MFTGSLTKEGSFWCLLHTRNDAPRRFSCNDGLRRPRAAHQRVEQRHHRHQTRARCRAQFFELPLKVYKANLDFNPETKRYKVDECTGKRSGRPNGCTGTNIAPLVCDDESKPCSCSGDYKAAARPGFSAPSDGDWSKSRPTTNHCSDPTGTLSNADVGTATCCDGHDFCYGAAFTTKAQCDQSFGHCLKSLRDADGERKYSDTTVSIALYALQFSYFKEGQQYAIECVPSTN